MLSGMAPGEPSSCQGGISVRATLTLTVLQGSFKGAIGVFRAPVRVPEEWSYKKRFQYRGPTRIP